MLVGCNMANHCLLQQYLPEAVREGKSQSWEREAAEKQYWRSQKLFVHGRLLTAMAGSCCAQCFQGGSSGSVPHPAALPFPHSTATQGHLDRECAEQGQAGTTGP